MSDKLKTLHDAATPGPWTAEKPGRDENGWPMGVVIGGVPGRQAIYASPPGGSMPYADLKLIIALRNATPEILALVAAVRDRANYGHVGVIIEDALAAYDAAVGNEGAK